MLDQYYEQWLENHAPKAYRVALDEGCLPVDAGLYRRTGDERPISFWDWVDTPDAEGVFERWYRSETDPDNRYDTDPRV